MLGILLLTAAIGVWAAIGAAALVRYYDLVGWIRDSALLDCIAAVLAGPAMWLVVGSVRRAQEEDARMMAQMQEWIKETENEQDR